MQTTRTSPRSEDGDKEVNCTYDPYKCYEECRAFAESINATAFTFPSFPLGDMPPERSARRILKGRLMNIGSTTTLPDSTKFHRKVHAFE